MQQGSLTHMPHKKWLTLSTVITVLRIVLVPPIVYAIQMQEWYWACALFLIAAITDILDGAVARARNEQTEFGACLDPVADKILLVSTFIALAYAQTAYVVIPLWFVGIVFGKELLMIMGTCMFYACNKQITIVPTRFGKMGTFIQICFIVWIFACYWLSWPVGTCHNALLLGIASMIMATLVHYSVIAKNAWYATKKEDI